MSSTNLAAEYPAASELSAAPHLPGNSTEPGGNSASGPQGNSAGEQKRRRRNNRGNNVDGQSGMRGGRAATADDVGQGGETERNGGPRPRGEIRHGGRPARHDRRGAMSSATNKLQSMHIESQHGPTRGGEDDASGHSGQSTPLSFGAERPQRPRRNKKPLTPGGETSRSTESSVPAEVGPSRGAGRRRKINARLTEPAEAMSTETPRAPQKKVEHAQPKIDNLTSRLIHSLRTPPFPDCPICFSSIHPAQPIWSCSPSTPRSGLPDDDSSQCCYTPFHLKCIKSWANKSVNETSDAYRVRGEDRKGEWRCPGCQRRRTAVPHAYMCFCYAVPDPKPPRIATPHSCGNPCARPRPCGHGCPLSCHPGPCPPCQITMHLPCHCAREMKFFRCADLTAATAGSSAAGSAATVASLSCGRPCDKALGCGQHRCELPCHRGECPECPVVERGRCYCGKTERELKCGEGVEEDCTVEIDGKKEQWNGRFVCDKECEREFDCGIHKCEKPCHPPSMRAPPCPRSPSLITHCPCGKKALEDMDARQREKCTDQVPTCGSICMKALDGCSHVCSVPCHLGPCPPCAIPVIIPCRCSSTTRAVPCNHSSSATEPLEILCDRPCTALRACGRHQCNRLCCPLASLAAGTKARGKKKVLLDEGVVDEAGWHECDLVCGKGLACGNHRCEERDHRGACPPCLRSSFDEMICHCGRTVIEPPVPCGTRMSCTYPCALPPPCGHPRNPHSCHEAPAPCPPCAFLTAKPCTCGKKVVPNVRCSQEKVSCGTVCGKLLGCGFHHCERLCHGEDCGKCTSVCGKPRKLCLPAHHPCTLPCHAPASCSEFEPCKATITLKCPCGRIQLPSACGRCSTNEAGREATQQPKCSNDCLVARRNARLAEALGISSDVAERDAARPVVYSDELGAFARANARFCVLVEKSFADFVASEKKSQVLPYMPEARRRFVHDLAMIYRMDTQLIDQEPRRSVQLIRRIDTRIPKPLLSAVAAQSSNLGRLADLRATSAARGPNSAVVSSSSSSPASVGTTVKRGWTSVVATASTQVPNRASQAQPTTNTRSTASTANEAWVAPSALARSAANSVIARVKENSQASEPVPDDWENDDV